MRNNKIAEDFLYFADLDLGECLGSAVCLHAPVVADTALPVVESFVNFNLHYV